jgi:predicted nucleic acid-binding protein
MARIVDSTVLITLERRGDPNVGLRAMSEVEESAIATITVSEIAFGIYRANSEERRRRRESFLSEIIGAVAILPFDLQVARRHAELWAELASAGSLIPPHDLIIAATALTHGYSVLTDNLRDFQRVPGLVVSQPDWDASD